MAYDKKYEHKPNRGISIIEDKNIAIKKAYIQIIISFIFKLSS